jgi:glyoxylase-like metal-dependent hydrolase (beta-lactamase superfamily II)
LDTRGRQGLAAAKQSAPELRDVEIALPHLVFETGILSVRLGNKTVELSHSPGHSPDSIVALVREDRVMFAADTLMPLPYFVDGSYDDFITSLLALQNSGYENVVQGHGEVVLRGEIDTVIQNDLDYLAILKRRVEKVVNAQQGPEALQAIRIEDCGKSRIPLNGLVQDLHQANLRALYDDMAAKRYSMS